MVKDLPQPEHYHSFNTAKKYLPYVLIFLVLILLIPLYIQSYKNQSTKITLLLAPLTEELALSVITTYSELITFFPQFNNGYSGQFEVTTSSPSHINFKVINSQNQNITQSVNLAKDITSPSIISFNNNSGGAITIQYINSLDTNYLTRIDIVIN